MFATDEDTGRRVIIENQLEETDHDHLGKLITYTSGKAADLVIWLVRKARPEHRAAIEWLNNHTDEGVGFILCEIKLFRIGNSEPAPKFEIVNQHNDCVNVINAIRTDEESTLLANRHVSINDEEMSMQDWLRRITGWKSVETYKFAIHKGAGKSLSQIRKEYMDEN